MVTVSGKFKSGNLGIHEIGLDWSIRSPNEHLLRSREPLVRLSFAETQGGAPFVLRLLASPSRGEGEGRELGVYGF